MKTNLFALAAAGILCAAALPVAAQTAADPPAVLRIIREDIKEGKGSAHRNSENAFMLEAALGKYPANILGMTSMTGTGQAWFLEGHDSFGAVETTLAAFGKPDAKYAQLDELDAEFRSSSRAWLAVYRPDISFHGQELIENLPKARYFNVTMIRVQPGHDAEFAELGRMVVDASQKAVSDQPVVAYQIVYGLPDDTYLLFHPVASLKVLDGEAARSRAMLQAMGDSGAKRMMKGIGDIIASQESLLFSIDPRMSYVSKDFAAVDPAFWNAKPEEAKAPPKSRPKAVAKPEAK
jgi:hypothetical protein